MNKAITDGLVLMPPPFAAGLAVWSSGDGTPGSATWEGAANAAFVPADQDFAGCLELQKTTGTQRLRYMGETPLLPGCYLRICARVKAMSGNLPSVRIAAWAGGAGGAAVSGVTTTGPSVPLTAYGEVVTVSAIVGTGSRTGVDLQWGTQALYGHFGLDLTGANGGVVRIDDIVIEDVTGAFLRTMMDWVDVRDYGARGDGVTDDRAAFQAADLAAAGREILVPAGTYLIGTTLTINSPVRFEGKLTMPAAARLSLNGQFDLPTYIDAFGGDEMLGLRKALQALFNYADHDGLDMRGRRVEVTAPIDVQAAVQNQSVFAVRRVLRNGQLNVVEGPAWDTVQVTSQATYATANPLQLTGVANVANIPVGARVSGTGVGREVYVREKNVGAATVTLSKPLYGAAGTQVFTFRRYQYVLDFSGFAYIDKFVLQEVEVQCNGFASGILLPPDGMAFQMTDCHVIRPKDRGVTSHGLGCTAIQIDRCQFLSNEQSVKAQDRTTVAFNVNSNDAKIRDCRAMRFAHFAVMSGTAHLITGNHFFNGDEEPDGVRQAGLVLTEPTSRSTLVGNYIDNCFVELTNEHDATPAWNNDFSFGGLTVTGNIFLAIGVAPWFRWLVVKPYGPGHFLQGLSVVGNTFQAVNGAVDRVEKVDTSFASLDMTRARNVVFEGNSFNNVTQWTHNPVTLPFTQNTAQAAWLCEFAPPLPFGGRLRAVEGVVADQMITDAGNLRVTGMPYVDLEWGTGGTQVRLNWPVAAKGRVRIVGRMDNPV